VALGWSRIRTGIPLRPNSASEFARSVRRLMVADIVKNIEKSEESTGDNAIRSTKRKPVNIIKSIGKRYANVSGSGEKHILTMVSNTVRLIRNSERSGIADGARIMLNMSVLITINIRKPTEWSDLVIPRVAMRSKLTYALR